MGNQASEVGTASERKLAHLSGALRRLDDPEAIAELGNMLHRQYRELTGEELPVKIFMPKNPHSSTDRAGHLKMMRALSNAQLLAALELFEFEDPDDRLSLELIARERAGGANQTRAKNKS